MVGHPTLCFAAGNQHEGPQVAALVTSPVLPRSPANCGGGLLKDFLLDLFLGLTAVASGASPSVVKDAAAVELHCHGGLQFGATAAVASGNRIVEVKGFHGWRGWWWLVVAG